MGLSLPIALHKLSIFLRAYPYKFEKKEMPNYHGTNSQGNNYTVRPNGDFSYENTNGSRFYRDGAHDHYVDNRNGGWHYNANQDRYTSGRNFRETNGNRR